MAEENYPYQPTYEPNVPAQVQQRVPMHEQVAMLIERSAIAEKHIATLEQDMEQMTKFVMSVRTELGF
jgi:hypothetical protein